MKIAQHIAHIFIPRESNNQKAKILHSSSLIILALILILGQLVLSVTERIGPQVLGYAANISPDEVVRLTNEKRIANGLAPLSINPTLSQAAQAKGADMINKDYWAHNAPDGTQPWKFFTDFGYKYRYAGENLARDFSNASSAVEAWMNSPSHKENMLSPKYKEIGIGVIDGDLAGVDTTIIVQFFGSTYADVVPTVPVAQASTPSPLRTLIPTPQAEVKSQPKLSPTPKVAQVIISSFNTTRGISLAVVAILLMVLIIDAVVVSKRRIARIGGRTFAHLAFFGMIIAIALILKAGQIL